MILLQLIFNAELIQSIENNQVTWRLSAASEGSYDLQIKHDLSEEEFLIPVQITTAQDAFKPLIPINGVAFSQATVGYEKLRIFSSIFFFKHIPWLKTWGWLGAYILFSLVFSTGLRKALKLA